MRRAGDATEAVSVIYAVPFSLFFALRAQNNETPVTVFRNHVVVRIGNTYYDPSYGVTYGADLNQDPKEWVPSTDFLLQRFQEQALNNLLANMAGNQTKEFKDKQLRQIILWPK